jgi:hypothetical protein
MIVTFSLLLQKTLYRTRIGTTGTKAAPGSNQTTQHTKLQKQPQKRLQKTRNKREKTTSTIGGASQK